MKNKKYLVFFNPAAGSGRSRIFYKLYFNRIFQRNHLNYYTLETQKKGDINNFIRLNKDFIKANFHYIIAMGGDGTTWETISSMVKYNINEIPLMIFPFGSGNDLARSLNLPLYNPQKALKILLHGGEFDKIDVCSVNDQYFANYLSFGIEGEVIKRRELDIVQLPGYLSYFKPLIKTLEELQYHLYHITLKDKEFDFIGFTLIITNIPSMYGGLKIVPEALYNDGEFEITLIRKFPSIKTIGKLPFLHGHSFEKGEFLRFKTDYAKITFDDNPPGIQIDGEFYNTSEKSFEIKIYKHALTILKRSDI